MNRRLIINIAKALMFARWKQTLVAAIGVVFSITMFVTLLSFMNGLNDLLDSLILNRTPHIRLYNEIKPTKNQPINKDIAFKKGHNFIQSVKPNGGRLEIYNNASILKTLQNDSRVLGVAPKIAAQVFYNVGAIDLTGVINGIDVNAENKLFNFSEYVVTGNYIDIKNIPNSIILGKAAAEKMLAEIGDVIQVTTAKGDRMQLKVVGYFQSGLQDIDKVQSYCSISTTQKLLGKTNNYITDLNIKLYHIENAPEIAKEYSKIFNVDAVDIQTANSQFETGNHIRGLISYAVGITLLIVAGFGIYNILNMMIFEKMDSIAILKATGFSGKEVKYVFIVIALSIGIFGGLFGIIFGFSLSYLIDNLPFNTAAIPTITTFPINYDPKFYLIGTSFSIITTYFAGYFPAKKASKVDPVIIIRGK
ncbi:MAG: ABC transporter permease [Flavobacteriia bacterium]|nr:ABC transporter permease [Flavobacteriia bacterium]